MERQRIIKLMGITFDYYERLGLNWHEDPAGVEAIREVAVQMAADLNDLDTDPSNSELARLYELWRSRRIEPNGQPVYPPDMFIEAVCSVVEVTAQAG